MFVFSGDDGDDGILGIDGDPAQVGIAPGDGTTGGDGDDGNGLSAHTLDQSDVLSGELEVQAYGGMGGFGGGGGIGGASTHAFNGGTGGDGGQGGAGGSLGLTIDGVNADSVLVFAMAGFGGDGGGWDSTNFYGNGGKAATIGFNGGVGGDGGHGGAGGSASLVFIGSTLGDTLLQIAASDGGDGGYGGDGGASTLGVGGDGGNGGNGGDGGQGSLTITGNLFLTSDGRAFGAVGGNGGDSGYAGYGGNGTIPGSAAGIEGNGGAGGDAIVIVSGNTFDVTSDCGCEDTISVVAGGGQGGFGYASAESSAKDGVSGTGGNAVIHFTGNTISATTGDEVISLALVLGAGQGGVFSLDPTDPTAGTAGADGTTTLDFANNTIAGGAGVDTFRLHLENFVYDSAEDGYVNPQLGAVVIDLTDELFLIGSQTNVITGIENIDLIVMDGYYDDFDDFYNSSLGAYLRGNGVANEFYATEGDDTLIGEAGDDELDGYGGDDRLEGGLGNDTLYIDSAGDVVVELAGEGTDTLVSTITYSLVGSNIEHLYLDGWYDIDGTGDSGNNIITGSAGNNAIDGGAGADSMYGGDGDDTFYVDSLGDRVYEDAGMGRDVVYSSVTFSLLHRTVEHLYLTGTDNINATGNSQHNLIVGNDGNNLINGGLLNDRMYGGLGDDTYFVDELLDSVYEKNGEGTDVVYTSVDYDLTGRSVEFLYMTGGGHIQAFGNGYANTLTGNTGDNYLDGRAGNDTMTGGAGDDTYVVSTWADVVNELDGEGTDTVIATRSYTLSDHVENLTLYGASSINGTGNGLGNTLTDNEGVNVLTGGLGDDIYYIQTVGDKVVEKAGEGDDTVYTTVSFDLWGTYVETLILDGIDNIDAIGNNQSNRLFGNDGDNTFNGRGGADHMWGGAGADIFLFELNSRADTIYDFDAADGDVIDVSAYALGTPGTVIQSGLAALIQLGGGNSVRVENTLATDTDFLNAIIW